MVVLNGSFVRIVPRISDKSTGFMALIVGICQNALNCPERPY